MNNFNLEWKEIIKLSALEGMYKRYLEMQTTFSKIRSFSSKDFFEIVTRLEEYKKQFLEFETQAKYYNNLGKPELLTDLSKILNDIYYEIQNYRQKYQDKLNDEMGTQQIFQEISRDRRNADINRQKILRDAQIYTNNIIRDQLKSEQESNDRLNKRWHANFTESCIHCNEYLSGRYYRLEICPNCGRYLHR